MTVTYSDGRSAEAVLLSRTETTMRVAVQGADDVMEVSNINGRWVSADCEPVSIEFASSRIGRQEIVTEADCICSHELAARLIQLLFTDSSEDGVEMGTPADTRKRPGALYLSV